MSETQKHTKPNVPNLRFPGFEGEWVQFTLGELTELFSQRNKKRVEYPLFSVTNSRGFVNQQEQFEDREMKGEDIAAYKIISPGEFAYNPARINVGSIARYDGDSDCIISSLYVCFRAKKELVDPQLFLHILKSPKMVYNYGINGEGGVRVYLFYPNFARIRVKLPSVAEQCKIASFLDLIEERIRLQNKIIKDLKQIKESTTRKLLISNDSSGRFVTLGEITEVVTRRNRERAVYPMYSVTNDRGFIPQSEKFEDREMVGEDISAYKVVRKGEIAYNPARINVGSIAQYDGDEPCMISSLYVCIKAREGISSKWLIHVLRSEQLINYYNLYAEGGVRLYLFYPNFSKIKVYLPSLERQGIIANTIEAIEAKIRLETSLLSRYQLAKQSLLSRLFV